MLAGGIAVNFESSWRLGAGRDFVLEGDEYDSAFFDKTAKFFKYLPNIVVVNNIEYDHADIYPDLASLVAVFRQLVNQIPRSGLLVLGTGSRAAADLRPLAPCPVQTFGTGADADWHVHDIAVTPEHTTFRITRGGTPLGQFELPLIGAHNVLNAAAAIVVGAAVGLERPVLAEALRAFAGVRRRLEVRGTVGGVTIIDDFAHHPTAVRATLDAVRAAFAGRRIWALFEPRSASTCRRVFQRELAVALAQADEVVLAGVFRANLPEADRLSPQQLVEDVENLGTRARYLRTVDEIVATVAPEVRPGDLVLAMSNGGFDNIHERLLRALTSPSLR